MFMESIFLGNKSKIDAFQLFSTKDGRKFVIPARANELAFPMGSSRIDRGLKK